MKRFGDCQIVHFGENERVAGFSMIQLIETSLISGHFANLTNSAYIDIFSCKNYEPEKAADFFKKFFKGNRIEIHVKKRW
jgi:S-adenosylmethionine/arginine decarboxylase-like enzyme